MPIYEYESTTETKCATCGSRFEVFQSMAEQALTACPDCGGPIARVFSTPSIHGVGANILSNKNLAEKGFTKYVKAGDGHYEKSAGKGPDVIKR